MENVKRIFILGHPGAGKAVLGQAVAEALNWDFIDADFGLEKHIGWPIEKILGDSGNRHYRDCEYHFLQQVKHREHIVIGTDAGIVLSDKSCELLADEYAVFVNVTLAVQLERFKRGKPSLMQESDLETLLSIIHQRDDKFTDVANITILTDDGELQAHVDSVLKDANLSSSQSNKINIKLDKSDLIQLHAQTYENVYLTDQQAVCLKLLAIGKSAKEIARELDISFRTVEGHIAKLKDLLGCTSSKELISLYLMGRP